METWLKYPHGTHRKWNIFKFGIHFPASYVSWSQSVALCFPHKLICKLKTLVTFDAMFLWFHKVLWLSLVSLSPHVDSPSTVRVQKAKITIHKKVNHENYPVLRGGFLFFLASSASFVAMGISTSSDSAGASSIPGTSGLTRIHCRGSLQ